MDQERLRRDEIERIDRESDDLPRGDSVGIMAQSKGWHVLFLICIVALALRVGCALHLGNDVLWDDEEWYDTVAYNIVDGHGYSFDGENPTSFRAPALSVFLAAVYYVFGRSLYTARVAMAFLGATICVLHYYLALRIFLSRSVGYVAAALTAVYPLFVLQNATLFPETLSMVFLNGVLLALLSLSGTRGKRKAAALGLLAALLILTSPMLVLFLICTLPWFLVQDIHSVRERFQIAAIGVIVCVAICLPWTIRNASVHRHFVPIATNSGLNLWEGNNPLTKIPIRHQKPPRFTPGPDTIGSAEWQLDRFYRQMAWNFVVSHPSTAARLFVQKAFNFWRLYPEPGTVNAVVTKRNKFVSAATYGPVLCLAVLSVFFSTIGKRERTLLLLLACSLTFGYAVFITKVRFRLPLDCALVLLASYPIAHLMKSTIGKLSLCSSVRRKRPIRDTDSGCLEREHLQ